GRPGEIAPDLGTLVAGPGCEARTPAKQVAWGAVPAQFPQPKLLALLAGNFGLPTSREAICRAAPIRSGNFWRTNWLTLPTLVISSNLGDWECLSHLLKTIKWRRPAWKTRRTATGFPARVYER